MYTKSPKYKTYFLLMQVQHGGCGQVRELHGARLHRGLGAAERVHHLQRHPDLRHRDRGRPALRGPAHGRDLHTQNGDMQIMASC